MEIRHNRSNGTGFPSTTYFAEWDDSVNEKLLNFFVAKSQNTKCWELEDPKILEDYLINKLLDYNINMPPGTPIMTLTFYTKYRNAEIAHTAQEANGKWKHVSIDSIVI